MASCLCHLEYPQARAMCSWDFPLCSPAAQAAVPPPPPLSSLLLKYRVFYAALAVLDFPV